MKEEDINEIKKISDASLGNGYLEKFDVYKFINKDNYFAWNLKKENNIIGFIVGANQYPEEVNEYLNISYQNYPTSLKNKNRIGVIRAVVVKEKYRSKGLGTLLMKKMLKWLKELTDIIYTIIWEKEEDSAKEIIERFGFNLSKKIPQYWEEESIKKEYPCPYCGEPPCLCTALLYTKKY